MEIVFHRNKIWCKINGWVDWIVLVYLFNVRIIWGGRRDVGIRSRPATMQSGILQWCKLLWPHWWRSEAFPLFPLCLLTPSTSKTELSHRLVLGHLRTLGTSLRCSRSNGSHHSWEVRCPSSTQVCTYWSVSINFSIAKVSCVCSWGLACLKAMEDEHKVMGSFAFSVSSSSPYLTLFKVALVVFLESTWALLSSNLEPNSQILFFF